MENFEKKYGYNTHRLIPEDEYHEKEIAFIETFNEELKWNSLFIEQIVNKNKKQDYLTEEEEKVALSVIQWLGTPVGQGFLDKVEKYGK